MTPPEATLPTGTVTFAFNTLSLHPFARRLAACCQSLHQQGFAPGMQACLSACDEGLRWITPRGIRFAAMQPNSFIVSWPDERVRIIAPELEFPKAAAALHDAIYRARPDIQSIIQTPLPPAFAHALSQSPPSDAFAFLSTLNEDSPLRIAICTETCEQTNGSGVLNAEWRTLVEMNDVILSANHGVLVLGTSPEAALATLELLHWAKLPG